MKVAKSYYPVFCFSQEKKDFNGMHFYFVDKLSTCPFMQLIL